MLRKTYDERLHALIMHSLKSNSTGKNGKIFESCVRGANNKFDVLNARQNRCDCVVTLNGIEYRTEVKSGCGELKVLDFDGTVLSDVMNNEMIVYTMEFDGIQLWKENCDNPDEDYIDTFNRMLRDGLLKYPVYAMTPADFMTALNEVGLVREKTSTAMGKKPPQEQFYDRISIQSFKNSKKRMTAFSEALETYGMKVTEFK